MTSRRLIKRVGYLTFGRDELGYGLALCLSRLQGYEVFRVTPKTARYVDALLFSCFWWEHIYLLADFLRRAGIKKEDGERPLIVVGGFNTFNPVPFLAYADRVVVGDGEQVLPALLADPDGKHGGVYSGGSVKWQSVPLEPFCHETNQVARIEIARGCRHKCKFCAVTHLKPYRELPIEGVKESLRRAKPPRVSLFCPEPTLHSQDDEVTALCRQYKKTRVDSDVRLDRLDLRADSVPRVGIEGLSYRLRKSVNKPYSNEKIIAAVERAIKDGRKGLFFYMILDLPGETREDWEEFDALLRRIGELPGAKDFLLKPSPSVFMPNPHTPMEGEGIHWDRPCGKMWEDFFGRGEARTWRVQMAERSRVFGGGKRILSMLATRSGEEFAEIERELAGKKMVSVGSGGRVDCAPIDQLVGALAPFGGPDRWCRPMDEATLAVAPWKIVEVAAT